MFAQISFVIHSAATVLLRNTKVKQIRSVYFCQLICLSFLQIRAKGT